MPAWSCHARISGNASGDSQLHRLTGGYLRTFFLTYLLTLFLTFFLAYLLTVCLPCFLIYLLTFCLTFFLAFSWQSVWHAFWHIFWHSVWHSFWHILWHSFWHFFWHSFDILSEMSSDILADISSDIRSRGRGPEDRGWGPAGNTGRRGSWLRSGREHWPWLLSVEVWQRTLETWGSRRRRRKAEGED